MSAEEFTGLGFAPGSVKGVRSFRVDKFGRLTGVVYKEVWTPGENVAQCLKDDGPVMWSGHGSYSFNIIPSSYSISNADPTFGRRGKAKPQVTATPKPKPLQHAFENCSCGFYGYFDGSDDYHDNAMITAVVEAYGETIIGTRGFRAMKAKILAIRVKADTDGIAKHVARKLATNYKGVAIFDDFERMVAEFPPDVSLEPSPDTDPDFWTR